MTLSPSSASAARDSGAPPALPAAVLWDMDGTLIDTEPHWIAAETELVEAHGGVWTHEDGAAMVGNPMAVAVVALQERGVTRSAEEIAAFLNGRVGAGVAAGVPWQPGAHELLLALRDAGVPMALVTSSFRVLAEPFARTVGLFDVVVAGDDVTRPKPDPEPYLTAARLLGVPVEECVAVEDSRSGVASAVASGARVVAVEVMQPIEARPGLSRVRSLVDVGLDDLARVAGGDVLDTLTTR
ncbi:HAD family hydrolase [Cellulomonas biazotea]|uniref:Phosphoglycolate phosphatase n=1 Tax=Cellulomonas biazotea TaxID=1709 RepID=A0A402DVE2_9CELL|nr:HAD family phosphatase [Cellulomonas biazotea]GCE78094.1 phosphoglycolate phosphatase [Cellulomonas biazotea]